jgi:hypothetical protein
MSMSAIAPHALQEVFVTTQKEGTGALVEQEGSLTNKAIHVTLISA